MVPSSMKPVKHLLAMLLALGAMVLLNGCGSGGGNSASASVEKSSVVVGQLAASKSAGVSLAADPITVYVLSDPSITTSVASDGTFTLRGLPSGSFTLVFMQGTTELGRLDFGQVAPNQQITITVQLVSNEIVLVDESRTGIGDAGVELEGPIQNVVTLNLTGDSRFVIQGRSVVVRPGVTAIRKGNTAKTVNDLTLGTQVHVKGTTVQGSTDVLAFEVIIQDTSSTGTGTTETQMTICHIPPGNPTHPVTITIGSSAWPAHQAHGDTEGACKA